MESVDALGAGDHLRLVGDRGPDRGLADKLQLETLRGALAELSEAHERILILRELEELSYREIGDRMHLTRPGVESTLFRARRRLESEFAELETGRRCLTVRGAMGRIDAGLGLRRDRGKVVRHVRRCTACRATARELGLVPERRPSRAARASAVLPLPAFLVRRLGAPSAPGLELAGGFGAKGTALVASLALAGGGAAIEGGQGPRAADASAPRDARPSEAVRSGHSQVADARAASASSGRPAGRRAALATARVEGLSGMGPPAGRARSATPALTLDDLERRPAKPRVARTAPARAPASDRPARPAAVLERVEDSGLGERAPEATSLPPATRTVPVSAAPTSGTSAPGASVPPPAGATEAPTRTHRAAPASARQDFSLTS